MTHLDVADVVAGAAEVRGAFRLDGLVQRLAGNVRIELLDGLEINLCIHHITSLST